MWSVTDVARQTEPVSNGGGCSTAEIAKAAHCTPRSISTARSNLRCFGSVKAPPNGIGRRRTITPPMLEALCERLLEKPDQPR
ncbi:hypothetical protein PENARI_c093G01652 [Penicillium arizonense]|uniref:Uncharacterized protein n=1 Tax=Penicillium arizonense TaxID=1835702 RepID=A0A1F5L0Z3_PENAI|nr:hypothetical protein PENARI_c093G01652 [Penicillium arizonense]OGE46893.1 hypothetical protein PENARI_c093G01652 [Penicillium arizonense]